jgi:hypothetical protein
MLDPWLRELVMLDPCPPVLARNSDDRERDEPRSKEGLGREGLRVGGRDSCMRGALGGAERADGSEAPARMELGEPRSKVPGPDGG